MSARVEGVERGFYGLLLAVCAASFIAHEGAHALAGQLLGYDMAMTLNRAWPRAGGYASATHAQLVTAAGPAFTIVQGLIGAALVRWRRRGAHAAYAALFAATFMRFAAACVSLVHPNDEARLSLDWGLGHWSVPAVVVLGLLILTIDASRRLRLGWRTNVLAYVTCSLVCAVVVGSDAWLTRWVVR